MVRTAIRKLAEELSPRPDFLGGTSWDFMGKSISFCLPIPVGSRSDGRVGSGAGQLPCTYHHRGLASQQIDRPSLQACSSLKSCQLVDYSLARR